MCTYVQISKHRYIRPHSDIKTQAWARAPMLGYRNTDMWAHTWILKHGYMSPHSDIKTRVCRFFFSLCLLLSTLSSPHPSMLEYCNTGTLVLFLFLLLSTLSPPSPSIVSKCYLNLSPYRHYNCQEIRVCWPTPKY
jgi:hypothetical protein